MVNIGDPVLRVHLINGQYVDSGVCTKEDLVYAAELKTQLRDLLDTSINTSGPNWYIDVKTGNGWVIVPGASVLYVEMVNYGKEAE